MSNVVFCSCANTEKDIPRIKANKKAIFSLEYYLSSRDNNSIINYLFLEDVEKLRNPLVPPPKKQHNK